MARRERVARIAAGEVFPVPSAKDWASFRERVLVRDGGLCSDCGAAGAGLVVIDMGANADDRPGGVMWSGSWDIETYVTRCRSCQGRRNLYEGMRQPHVALREARRLELRATARR